MENMNFKLLKYGCLAVMLCSALTCKQLHTQEVGNTTTNTTISTQNDTLQKEMLEFLDNCLQETITQAIRLDATLEELATVINDGLVRNIKNKGSHIEQLKALRGTVKSITHNSYTKLDPQQIFGLIYITQSLAQFTLERIEDGFKSIRDFNIDCIEIPHKETITPDDIQIGLAKNIQLLQKLEATSMQVGLEWYNKLYRKTKPYVMRPWKRYHLAKVLGGTTTFAAAASLLLWRFKGWFTNTRIPFTNIKPFGPVPLFDVAGNLLGGKENDSDLPKGVWKILKKEKLVDNSGTSYRLIEPNELGIIGQIENFWQGIKRHDAYPLTGLAAAAAGTVFWDRTPKITGWISEKIQIADNMLMGGRYRNRSVGNVLHESKKNYDDVVGCKPAKAIGKTWCEYMKNPESFNTRKLQPAKGCLLVGPSRTGKTHFVEATLGELKRELKDGFNEFKIIKLNYTLIKEMGIESILAYAKEIAPCILFIDEIDLLGLQRSDDRKLLSEFLTALSGYLTDIDPENMVIIIGATNKPESLDFALKQPGRLAEVTIPFINPTYAERKEFIKRELEKLAVDPNLFNIDQFASETEGCVFESIGIVIKNALIQAKIANRPISPELLEKSFDEYVRGIIIDAQQIPENQSNIIAAHLAGHALANILLEPHFKISKVTIEKVRADIQERSLWSQASDKHCQQEKQVDHGKIFCNHAKDALAFDNKDELIKECKITLAGHTAERIMLGDCAYSYHPDDKKEALEIAQKLVMGGLPLEQLPKNVRNKLLEDSYDLLTSCEKEIEELLDKNIKKLEVLTSALKEKGTLNISEIQNLLKEDK